MSNGAKAMKTLRDMVRYGASEFARHGLVFGHGTDNALDEALQLREIRPGVEATVDRTNDVDLWPGIGIGIGVVGPQVIDRTNILRAALRAMAMAALVAKSPCAGSRARSTCRGSVATSSGNSLPIRLSTA